MSKIILKFLYFWTFSTFAFLILLQEKLKYFLNFHCFLMSELVVGDSVAQLKKAEGAEDGCVGDGWRDGGRWYLNLL